MGKTMNKTSERLSLSERIARASAIRDRAATVQPDRELIDAERRSAFGPCYIYRAHADVCAFRHYGVVSYRGQGLLCVFRKVRHQ